MTNEERHRPDVKKTYEREEMVVHWEPGLCIHVGNCLRALPAVFDATARPWIRVDAASAHEIAAAIETCPSGALWYERSDGPGEAPDMPTTVQARKNGPLLIRGDLRVVDARGEVVREATRLSLCRCGNSANKPYCDLSHRRVGFQG